MSLLITPILCNAGFMDNYAYILIDDETGISAVVDAAEEKAVAEKCRELKIKPSFILTTHHHEDHTNANLALKKMFGLRVVAPLAEKGKIPGADIFLNDGELFNLGKITVQSILVPGHTLGHCLWYFAEQKALFTGDVLFNLCMGGIFEGTPEQMWQSLQKIKTLPNDVRFYPGHEYTRVSREYFAQNKDIPEFREYLDFLSRCNSEKRPPVGIALGLEKVCNPYLRIKSEKEFTALVG